MIEQKKEKNLDEFTDEWIQMHGPKGFYERCKKMLEIAERNIEEHHNEVCADILDDIIPFLKAYVNTLQKKAEF